MISFSDQIVILVNLIPIIIIPTLILIVLSIINNLVQLSIENSFIYKKNVLNYKKKIYYLSLGIISIIFLTTFQTIFGLIFQVEAINNINNITNEELLYIRDSNIWFYLIFVQMYFIINLSLKTSFFNSLIPAIFLILLQYILPVMDFEVIASYDNVVQFIIFILFFLGTAAFVRLFFKKKLFISKILFSLSIPAFLVVNSLVNLLFDLKQYTLPFTLINVLALLYFFALGLIADNISSKILRANVLRKNIMIDNFNFIRDSYSQEYFTRWVFENKMTQGHIFKLDLVNRRYITKHFGAEYTFLIFKKTLDVLCKEFENDFLFLRGKKGEFYFFYKRKKINDLKNIFLQIKNKLPKNFIFNENKVNLKFKFYYAQYGINANDYINLIKCLEKASKNKGANNDSFIIKYKSEGYLEKLQQKNNFSTLKDNIFLDLIDIKIFEINNIWSVSVFFNSKEVVNFAEFTKTIDDFNVKNLLVRHIAFKALKFFSYEVGVIKIPYLSSIVEDKHFDLKYFLKVINEFGIKYNNIILDFIDKDIDKNSIFYKEIKNLGFILK